MAKRYVLLTAEEDLSDEDMDSLSKVLTQRHGRVSVIQVKSNPRALIVKTTNAAAPALRESSGKIKVGGKTLVTVLTSGSIGKLKNRAAGSSARADGKVP